MTFSWTYALVALALVPAALAAYLWLLRRRRRTAIRFSNVALVRAALPARSRWRRHVPFALVLAAVGLLALGSARPQVSVQVPMQRTSVILAIDVSRSMCAVDVEPNRLSAAQEAVRGFIQDQDDDTRIGLVAFAGYAELVVAPTVDRQSLVDAVDALTTGRGTTIGAAILKAVDAIAAINPDVAPVGPTEADGETGGDDRGWGSGPAPSPSAGPVPAPSPTPAREPVPDIVVLLTDGANTRGITPVAAARVAATRG
ncbi:MAG TPA: VWA domain-containing protein, partial [Candidatus Lustribacter sp.]|nr:VWA domain-containing protein [Candidatus Lustribacter sp.]